MYVMYIMYKKYFLKVTLELGYVPLRQSSRLKVKKQLSYYFLCFVFYAYLVFKNQIFKKIFSKGNYKTRLCMSMTNFKVVGIKTTKLRSFYILCVFCIFGIEKF